MECLAKPGIGLKTVKIRYESATIKFIVSVSFFLSFFLFFSFSFFFFLNKNTFLTSKMS